MESTHHLADYPGALHVTAVGPQPHLAGLVEDAPLHRFHPIAGVRQSAGVDHRVGVLQERAAHLLADVDVDYPLGDLRRGRQCRGSSGHPPIVDRNPPAEVFRHGFPASVFW